MEQLESMKKEVSVGKAAEMGYKGEMKCHIDKLIKEGKEYMQQVSSLLKEGNIPSNEPVKL